jgi:microsomal dipeptidase-like Zn-dependent dipeptidase
MTILITQEDVVKHNRLPPDTQIIDEHIEEAQNIIDARLGSSFDLTLISTANKGFYYNAVKKMVLVLMLELPNSDYLWNTNARYENTEVDQDKKELINSLNSRIDFYISKIQEEMIDDGTDTEQIDEVLKVPGMTFVCIGGDEDYYPENNYIKYPDGVRDVQKIR